MNPEPARENANFDPRFVGSHDKKIYHNHVARHEFSHGTEGSQCAIRWQKVRGQLEGKWNGKLQLEAEEDDKERGSEGMAKYERRASTSSSGRRWRALRKCTASWESIIECSIRHQGGAYQRSHWQQEPRLRDEWGGSSMGSCPCRDRICLARLPSLSQSHTPKQHTV